MHFCEHGLAFLVSQHVLCEKFLHWLMKRNKCRCRYRFSTFDLHCSLPRLAYPKQWIARYIVKGLTHTRKKTGLTPRMWYTCWQLWTARWTRFLTIVLTIVCCWKEIKMRSALQADKANVNIYISIYKYYIAIHCFFQDLKKLRSVWPGSYQGNLKW